MNVGIIGAGAVGRALATLIQAGGHEVVFSARSPAAEQVSFEEAARFGDIVVLAVPYTATATLLPPLAEGLAGKIVIDATNPLGDDWSPLPLGSDTSGAEEIAKALPKAKVVKAFNTVFADIMTPTGLSRLGAKVTAFVAGDDADARDAVLRLAQSAGFAPVETGPLLTARYLEAMAHLNIAIAVGQSGGTNAAFLYHKGKAE